MLYSTQVFRVSSLVVLIDFVALQELFAFFLRPQAKESGLILSSPLHLH